jgi:hypothetical protein
MYADLLLFFCVSMTLAVWLHSVSVIPLSSATLVAHTHTHTTSQPPTQPLPLLMYVDLMLFFCVSMTLAVRLHSVSVIPLLRDTRSLISQPLTMSTQRTCAKCGKELNSAAGLNQHIKDYHQPQVRVQYPAGSTAAATTVITRLGDGFFHCPCGRKIRQPYRLQTHAKTCNGTGGSSVAAATGTAGSDAPPPPPRLQATTTTRNVLVPRDCTDADGLASLGLLVNTQAKIIICSGCGYAVGADHLATHMRDRHKLTRLPSGFGHRLVEKYGVWERPYRPPLHDGVEAGKAIGGLPIYPGFRCTTCVYFCRARASMLEHIRLRHRDWDGGGCEEEEEGGSGGAASPSPAAPSSMMTACRVQTIFAGTFTRYFGVLDDDQERSTATIPSWETVKRRLDEQVKEREAAATATATTRLPDNPRQSNPFILCVRWDRKLRGEHSEDDYVRFVAQPRDDEGRGLKMLPQMALDYVHVVSNEIPDGDGLLRMKMLALSR